MSYGHDGDAPMDHISRTDALNRSYKFYFTGKPCSYGHTANRYVATRGCFECNKAGNRKIRNRDHRAERSYRGHNHDFMCLTEAQKDAWYAQVNDIRNGKRFLFGSKSRTYDRTLPLEERPVIFAPPVLESHNERTERLSRAQLDRALISDRIRRSKMALK